MSPIPAKTPKLIPLLEETTLSPFLSSKKVGHFLTNKGPSFSMTTIQDVARILRRDCPAQEPISLERVGIRSLADDQWPLDGTENPEEAEQRWSKGSTTKYDRDHQHSNKRRRLLDPTNTNSMASVGDPVTILDPRTISTNVTTMHDSSSFSSTLHGGFTTAASQLQVIEAEAARPTTIADGLGFHKANPGNKPSKVSLSTKRSAGQSSLASFFGVKDAASPRLVSIPVPKPRSSLPKAFPKETFEDFTIVKHQQSLSNQVLPPLNPLISEPILPAPRLPLQAIPQTLSTHRLQPLPTTRPQAPPIDDTMPSKSYAFLSSPPSKPPSPVLHHQEEKDPAISGAARMDTAMVPASTLHTTSVQQVGIRRTLGVKRSMNGWAERGRGNGNGNGKGKGGFAVPRRVG